MAVRNSCRPAPALQFAHADKRVLFARRMPLVVEVMQQRGGGVEVHQGFALVSAQSQAVGLRLAIGGDAGLHGQRVLAQALALLSIRSIRARPAPARFTVTRICSSYVISPCCCIWFVFFRVFQGMMGET